MRPARSRRSSPDGPIDLRSDTVTRPTKQMREAMAAAEVDDDVLGRDPTMRELETRVAGLLGTDDALWTPSGSMGNLIALMSHLQRGDAFLAPAGAHVLDAELGTAAWLAGGMPRPLPHDAGPGKVSPDAVRRAAGTAGPYYTLRTTLLCLENTHNAAGGTVTAPDEHAAVAAAARAAGLRVHLDGARLWHAAVALGVPPATLTVGVDTVQVCFSKGLGAPVGSAVAGSAEFVRGGAAAAQDARRRGPAGRGARRGGAGRAGPDGPAGRGPRAGDGAGRGLRERGWSVARPRDQHRARPGRRPRRHAAPLRRRRGARQQHGREGAADAARRPHRRRHRRRAGPHRSGRPDADGRADGARPARSWARRSRGAGRAPARRAGR